MHDASDDYYLIVLVVKLYTHRKSTVACSEDLPEGGHVRLERFRPCKVHILSFR